jgi:hypothetical protein
MALTSPARRIETPHIFPLNPTPSYTAPYNDQFSSAFTVSKTARLSHPFLPARSPSQDSQPIAARKRKAHRWRLNRLLHHRQVIQSLFNQQPNDTVGIEQEISSRGLLVPDYRVQRLQLRRLWESEDRWR